MNTVSPTVWPLSTSQPYSHAPHQVSEHTAQIFWASLHLTQNSHHQRKRFVTAWVGQELCSSSTAMYQCVLARVFAWIRHKAGAGPQGLFPLKALTCGLTCNHRFVLDLISWAFWHLIGKCLLALIYVSFLFQSARILCSFLTEEWVSFLLRLTVLLSLHSYPA